MPTRIISWQQLVLENDPDWVRLSLNPVVWEFSNGRRFVDPAQPYGANNPSGLLNFNGILQLVEPSGWPMTSAGLSANAVWDNSSLVSVVPGGSFSGGAPMFFGSITASQLLLFGAGSLPTTQPTIGSLQLWNNGGLVCVA